jgi:hypothetical protein
MKYLSIALIYIAFFALIGSTCFFLDSALPLISLILIPALSFKSDKSE